MDGLTQAEYARIETAFHAVLEAPEAQCDALLQRLLEGQPRLIDAVRQLLQARPGRSNLDRPVFSGDSASKPSDRADKAADSSLPPGSTIGAWTVVKLLARGGMSRVYLVQRSIDGATQQAALKLISADADPQRFALERRVLARLEHPGIARLIDGGISDDGRPWLASEYVSGQTLLDYCEARRADLRQRIRLLVEVAEAVAYAHAHLVVHRDIKPANILISEDGHAKLVDFGIAKLLEDDAAAGTRTGTALMTPQYAAPEQVLGLPVTVQTDVHALGLLACEVLSGCNPFARPGDPALKVSRAIAELEPAPPSALCAQPALARRLRGDVDAIVLKAMRKSPAQRYPTAASVAADLRQFLAGDTVAARRGSRGYRLRSLVRRYRWALAVAVVVLGLVVAEVSMRMQQLTTERDRATAVAGFLRGLVSDLDPGVRNTRDAHKLTVVEVLDTGRQRLAHERLNPALKAQLLVQLAQSYGDLFQWQRSEATAREATRLVRTHALAAGLGLEAKMAQARALAGQQRHAEAEAIYRALLADDADDDRQRGMVLSGYGAQLFMQGRSREAVQQLRDASRLLRRAGDNATLTGTLRLLANAEDRMGHADQALAAAHEALDMTDAAFPGNQVALALSETAYADILGKRQPQAAEPILARALQRFRRVLGDDNHNTRSAENNHALLLWRLHRHAEAEASLRSNIRHQAAVMGERSLEVGRGLQNLAALQYERGKHADSVRTAQQALTILDATLPAGHLQRAFPHLTMAGAQLALEQAAAAQASLTAAERILAPALPANALPRKVLRARQAMALAATGACARALPLLDTARRDLGSAADRYAPEFTRARAYCEADTRHE